MIGLNKLLRMVPATIVITAGFALPASAGSVTTLNPTTCDIEITINNSDRISLMGTSATKNWTPSASVNVLVSNPGDVFGRGGEFGSKNTIWVSPRSGGGGAQLDLDIPDKIRRSGRDVQLHIFFCGGAESATYVALSDDNVFASGALTWL